MSSAKPETHVHRLVRSKVYRVTFVGWTLAFGAALLWLRWPHEELWWIFLGAAVVDFVGRLALPSPKYLYVALPCTLVTLGALIAFLVEVVS